MAAEAELNAYIEGSIEKLGVLMDKLGEGGQLQAAWRQGLDEIGTALKAFPDSIQIDEPGTVGNPLYRDMEGRSDSGGAVEPAVLLSPSQIADSVGPQGSVYGDAPQMSSSLPTPSELVANPTPYLPPAADMGTAHGQDVGNDMGRDM